MLAEERRFKIQEILSRQTSVTIADMVEAFGTSEMTIRRDLDELETRGICQRIHGGAISLRINDYRTDGNYIYPPIRCASTPGTGETAIGRRAAALVRPGDTIVIDSGTTAAHLAHALRSTTGAITVISNSIGVLAQLYDVTSISLISPAAHYPWRLFCAGWRHVICRADHRRRLARVPPQQGVHRASGLSVADGISTPDCSRRDQRTMIEIAEEVILITGPFQVRPGFRLHRAGMRSFHRIITTARRQPGRARAARHGVEVTLVEPAPDVSP